MATGSRTLKLSILADVAGLNKSLKQGETQLNGFTGKIQGFSDKISLAFKVAAAAAAAMAVKIGVDSIKAASDLGETVSKVGVLFGDSAKEIEKFAAGAAQSLGQTKQQALDAAANFAIFGSSAGLAGEDLVKFSTDFVSLAGDLASFNNVSQDEAINAIGSALRGEAEPLRKFGVLLDAATLEAAAFKLGIYDGSGALTAQQKVLAAQQVIFAQTTTAQGDFARTSDGLANKTKILTAELANTQLIIGEALLPIVLQLATAFSEKIVPLIKQFAQGLAGNQGLNKGLSDSESAAYQWGLRINGLTKIIVSFGDELAKVTAAIIGVFVVSKITAGVQATIIAIKALITAYNALKASAIVAGVATAFALNPLLGVGAVALAAGVLVAANKLVGLGNPKLPENFTDPTSRNTGVPDSIAGANRGGSGTSTMSSLASGINSSAIDSIISSSGSGSSGASSAVKNAISSAIPKGIVYPSAPNLTASEALFSSLTGTSGNFAGNSNARPGGVYGSNINITVNGAIDSESTARQIVTILNDSQSRGTQGASNLITTPGGMGF
jgi:hypothetical protein